LNLLEHFKQTLPTSSEALLCLMLPNKFNKSQLFYFLFKIWIPNNTFVMIGHDFKVGQFLKWKPKMRTSVKVIDPFFETKRKFFRNRFLPADFKVKRTYFFPQKNLPDIILQRTSLHQNHFSFYPLNTFKKHLCFPKNKTSGYITFN
jgi:hypothetical protein